MSTSKKTATKPNPKKTMWVKDFMAHNFYDNKKMAHYRVIVMLDTPLMDGLGIHVFTREDNLMPWEPLLDDSEENMLNIIMQYLTNTISSD